MTPTLLHQQHQVSAAAASIANSVATLALFIGCVVVGALCDRLGARRVLQAGSVALAICYLWLFSTIDSNPQMPVAAVRDHRLHDRHDRRDSVRDGPRVSGRSSLLGYFVLLQHRVRSVWRTDAHHRVAVREE